MCGIFTVIKDQPQDNDSLNKSVRELFESSKKRGREASGIGWLDGETLNIVKKVSDPALLLAQNSVRKFFESASDKKDRYMVFGHARLVTNGSETNQENNQPVVRDGLTVVHNGIIVNDAELWRKFPQLERRFDVDSEIFAALTAHFLKEGNSLSVAVAETFKLIKGAANVLVFSKDHDDIILGSNHGSLHWSYSHENRLFVAASELYSLQCLEKGRLNGQMGNIESGKRGTLLSLNLETFEFKKSDYRKDVTFRKSTRPLYKKLNYGIVKVLNRCKKCILPDTFPMIDLDENGVCRFCREGGKFKYKGEQALLDQVEPYRSKDGSPDCIVAFSGGRDSSFGLHYIKNTLKLNPIAYTYDWGMVTDIARRNTSRMCEALDVEHILRSADIPAKRSNIRKNVAAWLSRPDLGMIPLLMAGDKQFYYYASQVSKERKIPLIIFCAGNPYEKTEFKTGFCGIESHERAVLTRMKLRQKMQITLYYAKQFGLNWKYWNSSVFDTLHAYYSTYILKDNCVYLFDYIPFNENKINDILIGQYGWEVDKNINSTWRIGDGTACFYNFVYHTIAGFSEHDTFRSHQVRNGDITREQALEMIDRDNAPRFQAMEEYASLVGFNLNEALNVIMNAKKRY